MSDQSRISALALAAAALVGLGGLFVSRRALARARAALAKERARRSELALELMGVRNSLMHTHESLSRGRHPQFALRESDVAIVTFPKCGTTWMQAIVQALRSGCDMDFGEITEEMPWDILALDCGQDLDAEQRWQPRVFKSHEPADTVARGGRYIYVSRDPCDALFSFWKFLPSYAGLAETDVELEGFADAVFAGVSVSGQIWHHLLGWWRLRAQPNVLWVCFEDLKYDLETEVARVADFLGICHSDARDELVRNATAKASLGAMSSAENVVHYDDHFVRSKILPRMRVPQHARHSCGSPEAPNAAPIITKVRAGGGRVGYALPPALRARLVAKWEAVIAHETGLRDYPHLRATLRREREQGEATVQ